jgi:hypothetical protein
MRSRGALLVLALVVAGCASPSPRPAATPPRVASGAHTAAHAVAAPDARPSPETRPASAPAAPPVVVMAAGDIQSGPWSRRATYERTAQVLDANPHDVVLGLGDMSNDRGSPADYAQLDRAWGRHRSKLMAVPGSHDFIASADAFYDYFNGKGRADGLPAAGTHAGPRGRGYFAVHIGAWLLIGLNYCLAPSERFSPGDVQMRWLAQVMQSKPTGQPVIVISHTPRYTKASNHRENEAAVSVPWEILLRHKPDVRLFLCGHMNGVYERWVSMDNTRRADPAGIRSFTVGTGGQSPYRPGTPDLLLQRTAAVYGALRLVLRADGYDWEFKAVAGSSFHDRGEVRF